MNVQEILNELRAEANIPCENCGRLLDAEYKEHFPHDCDDCGGKRVARLVTVDREDLIAIIDAASPLRSIQNLTPEEKARDRISLAIIKVRCARNDLVARDGDHGDYGTCEAILLLLRDLQRRLS